MLLRGVTCCLLLLPAVWGQDKPRYDVASLKPNNGCEGLPRPGGNFSPSPGRLEVPCVNLMNLIQMAFGTFGDGVAVNPTPLHTEGGPSWQQSEYYSVSAKSDGPVRTEVLAGPMLQTLLADRFQLKTHWEQREMPIYALSVTKGGLKVQRLPDDACTPIDFTHPPPPGKPGDPPPKLCGIMMVGPTGKGEMMVEVRGATMAQIAQRLSGRVDRTVVDKTGIEGRYNIHLEYTPDPAPPGTSDPGPTLFVALQEQAGLKLTPEKGPVQFLIIDHVEKPSAN